MSITHERAEAAILIEKCRVRHLVQYMRIGKIAKIDMRPPGVEIEEQLHFRVEVMVSESRGAPRKERLIVSSGTQGAPCSCS